MAEDPGLATPRFLDALGLAVRLHGRDLRKGAGVPYASHLLQVCGLVLMDGGGEEEAVAALLHDAIEDHPEEISRESIEIRFGARVAAIVAACTDTPEGFAGGPKPPWRERKERYLARLRDAPPGVLRVSMADKLDNLRATVADYRRLGEDVWSRFNAGREGQLWYYRSLIAVYESRGRPCMLLDELRSAYSALLSLLPPKASHPVGPRAPLERPGERA